MTKMLEKTYAEIEESRRQAKDNEVECNQLRADMEKSKAENIRLRDRIKDFKRIGVPSFASQNTQEAY